MVCCVSDWGTRQPTWQRSKAENLFTVFFLLLFFICEHYWPFPIHKHQRVSVSLTSRQASTLRNEKLFFKISPFFFLLGLSFLFALRLRICSFGPVFPLYPLSLFVLVSLRSLNFTFWNVLWHFSFVGCKIYITLSLCVKGVENCQIFSIAMVWIEVGSFHETDRNSCWQFNPFVWGFMGISQTSAHWLRAKLNVYWSTV